MKLTTNTSQYASPSFAGMFIIGGKPHKVTEAIELLAKEGLKIGEKLNTRKLNDGDLCTFDFVNLTPRLPNNDQFILFVTNENSSNIENYYKSIIDNKNLFKEETQINSGWLKKNAWERRTDISKTLEKIRNASSPTFNDEIKVLSAQKVIDAITHDFFDFVNGVFKDVRINRNK